VGSCSVCSTTLIFFYFADEPQKWKKISKRFFMILQLVIKVRRNSHHGKKTEKIHFFGVHVHCAPATLTEDANEPVGEGQVRLLQVHGLAPESVLKLCACFLLLQGVPEAGLEARTQGCLFQKHRRSTRDCAR